MRISRLRKIIVFAVPLILLWLVIDAASWRPTQLNEKPELAIPAPAELPSNAAPLLRARLIPPFIRSIPPRATRLIAVSHDGERALIESPSPSRRFIVGVLQLWDVKSGRLVATLENEGREPGAIREGRVVTDAGYPYHEVLPYAVFSRDGKYIAAAFGSDDLAPRLWDARTGQLLRRFEIPDERVRRPRANTNLIGCGPPHMPVDEICSLDFTYDSRYLIVCSDCIYKPSDVKEIIWRWRVQ